MERYMKQYDKEYLKMAILKQEATFRQQVHELHHLYHVQQLLMREMKNTNKKIQLDEEYSGKQDGNILVQAYQESDLELTLATGSSNQRKKKETSSSASDSGSSLSSSARVSNGCRLFQAAEMDMGFKHVEEGMRQDGLKHHHPWFSQCLSLKMTWL